MSKHTILDDITELVAPPQGAGEEAMTRAIRRFRVDVGLDDATTTCPCGSSFFNGSWTPYEEYEAWKKKHAKHTDDGGKSYLEVNEPGAWSKCCSGPCPAPKVRHS